MQKFMKIRCRKLSITQSRFKWTQPEGFDTGIKVNNCVAKTSVPLIVQNKHFVSFYTCGPTVYHDSHIGHASCYMRVDILQRILRNHFGLNIVSTMNITDVDDKIIMRSNILNQPVEELSRKYEAAFWNDMDSMRISRPNHVLRVSENIDAIVAFVSTLLETKFAYKASDGSVYFDLETYQSVNNCTYGKLHNIGKGSNMTDNDGGTKKHFAKKNAQDFALWKAAKENEPSWDSPFGPGRPGWHIECSALASLHFGNAIDIHAGGIDLRFPHHENEEAQSCAFHKCNQWVNYWLHCGHLHLPNDAKMSKSLKNTISIQELLQMSPPNVFRMLCLLTNYKNAIEFSLDILKLAEGHVKLINNFIAKIDNAIKHNQLLIDEKIVLDLLSTSIAKVDECLRNDFNTADAMKHLGNLISTCNKIIHESASATVHTTKDSNAVLLAIRNYVMHLVNMFGLDLEPFADSQDFNNVMDLLVNFRHQLRTLSLVRKDRDVLEICDDLRSECKKLGISLKDHSKTSSWSR